MAFYRSIRVAEACIKSLHNGLKLKPVVDFKIFRYNGNRRYISTSFISTQNNSQYEYDAKNDTFRPKQQLSYPHQDNKGGQQGAKQNFVPFMKRFLRNLFILTGGIVWCGVVFVSLFVDVKETDVEIHLKDSEDEVRLLAFYDIAQTKTDLMQLMTKDKYYNDEEITTITNRKETAFLNALKMVKNEDRIIETLGKPVQLCGYRAAEKIDQMIQNFQNIAQYGIKNIVDESNKNKWKAECVLEGTKGLALLTFEFERTDVRNHWVLVKAEVESIEKSGNKFFDETGVLPDGLKLCC